MSLPTQLLPPPPVNPNEITNDILQANSAQNDMVKLLAGGRRKRRQNGGADVVEVPRIPVAYNDGGMMQKIYGQTISNDLQSTANAAGDSAIVTTKGGSYKKTKRQRRRKSKRTRKSKKSRKSRKTRR